MTPTERPPTFSPGQLADAFEDLVAGRRADYRDDLVGQVRATPQRPAWTFIERWLPMSLVIARPATATPLRGAWFLLLAGLVIAALVASLVIVGSALLRDEGPDGLDFGLVPTLELDETWQTTDSGAIEAAGIAVGLDGDLYAVDVPGDRIVVLDADGDLVHEWGSQGNGEGQFEFATYGPTSLEWGSVAVAPDGSVYVADTLNRRVQEFRPDGTFVRAWGGHGPDDGRFLMPIDVSVGADGTVYVVDTQREDIQAFTPDGTFLRVVEEGGASDGDPTRATGTRLDVGRSSYDIDLANGRLNAWLPDRHFHSSLLTNCTGALSLSTPGIKESSDTWTWELIDVAVAPDRTIYVAEPDRVVVISPDGELLSEWDIPATGTRSQIVPIALASDGTAYVSTVTGIYKLRIAMHERSTIASRVETPAVERPAASSGPATATPAGMRTVVVNYRFPLEVAYELPATWVGPEVNAGRVAVHGGSGPTWVNTFLVENVVKDPCHLDAGTLSPPVGPTVDDLVAALTALPGFRVASPVTDITIDGYAGKEFALETSIDPNDCSDATWLYQWTGRGAAQHSDAVEPFGSLAFSHQRLAVLDVGGTRVLLEVATFPEATRDEVAEADRIFESIDFRPSAAAGS